jgi:hypothetical protein
VPNGYHGIAPLTDPAFELFFVDRTVGFLFPMRPGEDCIALELQPEDFDAFRADPQAFLLADALGAWLDGGDWDETMAGYHATRDELLLPLYELTVGVLDGVSPPAVELDRLRAVLANPFTARGLSYWLPDNLAAFLAPGSVARAELFARSFAERREVGPLPAA